MDYRTVLLNSRAYGRISKAKEILNKKLNSDLSFSEVINEVLGKNLEFLDLDENLRAYIKSFADMLAKDADVLGVLLFGSVVKGTYSQYSDIDVLIVIANAASKADMLGVVSGIRMELQNYEGLLLRNRLPSSISPLIVHVKELDDFMPIHIDFADYGVVLYDYKNTLDGFLKKVGRIKHRREYTEFGEVVKWQA